MNRHILPLLWCLLYIPFLTHAQTSRVHGSVLDSKGGPLSGVTVTVKNSGAGTTTDSSGRFAITVPGPRSILVFSLVSYDSREEPVGRRVKMQVTLNEARAWSRHTSGPFDLRVFPGGHFYLNSQAAEVIAALRNHMK